MSRPAIENEDVRVIDFDLIRRSMKPKRKKRGRVPLDALAHEELFALLTTLRAANGGSLVQLFFRKRKVAHRTAMRRLAALVAAGYLGHVRLDGGRWIYHLTEKALALTPRLRLLGHRTLCVPPTERRAMGCWLRAALWASLVKDGYSVGQDGSALHALRRFHVDALLDRVKSATTAADRASADWLLQAVRTSEALKFPVRAACGRCGWRGPAFGALRCPSCKAATSQEIVEHQFRCRVCDVVVQDASVLKSDGAVLHDGKPCDGALRQTGVVPYDIAWRKKGERYEVILLVVDNPNRSIQDEIDELPFVCFGQESTPLILRSTDPHSRYDRKAKTWATVGERRAELVKAFGEKGLGDSLILLDYRPELQAYFHR